MIPPLFPIRMIRITRISTSALLKILTNIRLSQFVNDTVAFAPVLVELANNKKAVITEADLEEYPGMFLTNGKTGTGLSGDFAPYVLADLQNERSPVQALVTKRADYIAKTQGTRSFPW